MLGITAWKRRSPRPAPPGDHPSLRVLVTAVAPGGRRSAQGNGPAVTRHCGPAPPGPAARPPPSHHGRAAAQRRVPRGAPPPAIPAGTGLRAWRKERPPLPASSASEPPPFAARRRRPGTAPPPGGHRAANYSSRQPLRSRRCGFRPAPGWRGAERRGARGGARGPPSAMYRKHLQEIPSSSANVSTSLEWDPGKTSELLSGMGVSALKKDKLGNENTPQDLLVSSSCLPPKRQKVKDNEKDFVIVRRPWLLREAESGIYLDALPDELLLAIFAYLPLKDLLKVSVICKRWHRLSFDESLWQTLDLTGGNLLPGVLGQLLPAGVTVFRCPRSCIGDPLFKTSNLLKIQHLDLSNCTVSAADLHSILCLCTKLQNLSLEGLVLSDNIIKSIARNPNLIRLNLCGCSGFSAEALELMLNSCSMLEELNLSWCEFTATHVKAAVNNVTSKITQLNLSGYRENLQIADVKTLVERCPLLVHLDLSDSMMLKPECFQYFKQLVFLQHLCLSRCYQISPAALVELGEIRTLKTLQVFGIVTDSSLQLLEEALPDMKINGSHFTSIARPTVGNKKSHEIWGIKCRLTLRNPSFL